MLQFCKLWTLVTLSVVSLTTQSKSSVARPEFREIAVDRIQHFVVASEESMRNRAAVLAFAKTVCGTQRICFVHFWTSEAKAGRRIPMTDRQAGTIVASYNRNLNTGNDAFQCYNFGPRGEHC
jgi:hypothetical protein